MLSRTWPGATTGTRSSRPSARRSSGILASGDAPSSAHARCGISTRASVLWTSFPMSAERCQWLRETAGICRGGLDNMTDLCGRPLGGVKGVRSTAQRTLDATQRATKTENWPVVRHSAQLAMQAGHRYPSRLVGDSAAIARAFSQPLTNGNCRDSEPAVASEAVVLGTSFLQHRSACRGPGQRRD